MGYKCFNEENITAIANKIREKLGTQKKYTVSEMPEAIEQVYNESDIFIRTIVKPKIPSGLKEEKVDYYYLFCGYAWAAGPDYPDKETFKPINDIGKRFDPITQTYTGYDAYRMAGAFYTTPKIQYPFTKWFYRDYTKRYDDELYDEYGNKLPEKLEFNTSNVEMFSQMFYYCGTTEIPRINLQKANKPTTLFGSCSKLKIIWGLDLPDTNDGWNFNSWFTGCAQLTDIKEITGKIGRPAAAIDLSKTNLNADTIIRIIQALDENASGNNRVVSFPSTNLTESDKDRVTTEANLKTNWTITIV